MPSDSLVTVKPTLPFEERILIGDVALTLPAHQKGLSAVWLRLSSILAFLGSDALPRFKYVLISKGETVNIRFIKLL